MFYVHSSCPSNVKNIKGNIWPKQGSVVNTESIKSNDNIKYKEPESIKSNDNDILN